MKNKTVFSGNLYIIRKNKGILLIFALFLALIGGFFVFTKTESAKAWSEPNDNPPGGNVAAPINVSASPQTKLGPLTLGGGSDSLAGSLRIFPSSSERSDCDSTNPGEIYYYGGTVYYCNGTSWTEFGAGATGNFVLLNATNTGWTSIVAESSDFAIQGIAHSSSTPSYGVFGADNTNASAYAGYFQGNVKIIQGGAGSNTTLTLDSGVSLCFTDDCRSSWPSVGGGLWLEGQDPITLNPLAYLEMNAIVGSDSPDDSVFYINTNNWGSVVIGNPIELDKPEYYCGDGTCNTILGEDNITCTEDCAPYVSDIEVNTTFDPVREQANADFNWQVDEFVTVTSIKYGETDTYGSESMKLINVGPGAVALSLDFLDDDTEYHYTIYSEDIYGNLSYTPDATFTTPLGYSCGGCDIGLMCCPDSECHQCCTYADVNNECGSGKICCNQICYPGVCCTSAQCASGQLCCSDGTCRKTCSFGERNVPYLP